MVRRHRDMGTPFRGPATRIGLAPWHLHRRRPGAKLLAPARDGKAMHADAYLEQVVHRLGVLTYPEVRGPMPSARSLNHDRSTISGYVCR